VLGEKVLFIWEIEYLLSNLGMKSPCVVTLKKHLRSISKKPEDLGYRGMKGGIPRVYPLSGTWQYLLSLEQKGIIELREKGVTCAEDIFSPGLQLLEHPEGRIFLSKTPCL